MRRPARVGLARNPAQPILCALHAPAFSCLRKHVHGSRQPQRLHCRRRDRQLLARRRAPAPDPAGGEQAHRRTGAAAGRTPVRPAGARDRPHRSRPRPAAARLPDSRRAGRHPPRAEQPHRRGQRPPEPGHQSSHRPASATAGAACVHPRAPAGQPGHPLSRFRGRLRGSPARPRRAGGDHPAPETAAPVQAVEVWDDPLAFVTAPEHPLARNGR